MEKDEIYLKHVLDAIESILVYVSGLNKEEFIKIENQMMQDAVIRELEIIGEAVGKLSDDIKRNNPDLPWRNISDMRNKLIHEYFGVDLAVVWKTIEADLPILKKTILKLTEFLVEA